jgi:hypothetical protein
MINRRERARGGGCERRITQWKGRGSVKEEEEGHIAIVWLSSSDSLDRFLSRIPDSYMLWRVSIP